MAQLEFFETHPRFVEDLLIYIQPQLPTKVEGRYQIAEICAGKNAITNVLRRKGFNVYTNDLGHYADMNHHSFLDATKSQLYDELEKLEIKWLISNLPFNTAAALKIIELAVKREFKCAFILPLNFLEPSVDREWFLTNYPRTGEIVLPRYSFDKSGKTNMYGTAWQLWNTELIGNHTANRI